MNVGDSDANVSITFMDQDQKPVLGCGRKCMASIARNRSHVFYAAGISAIPDNTYGGALIESSEPIVAVVVDQTDDKWDAAIYNAIPLYWW